MLDNQKICSVTGEPAFASFQGGYGTAWYGSRHDMDLMVDKTGELDGPVCDEIISERKAEGSIVVFGNSWDGSGSAVGLLPAEVAARIFADASLAQVRLIRGEKAEDAGEMDAPEWQRPFLSFVGHHVVLWDFRMMGVLHGLSKLARGEDVDPDRAFEDGLAAHAFAMQREHVEEARHAASLGVSA